MKGFWQFNLIVLDFGLHILFLGNFMEAAPPQTLIDMLDTFLQYSSDLGKLTIEYKLYGERQISSTTSPGDKLFEILQKPPFDTHFSITGNWP